MKNFTLYRENKVANEWTITLPELEERYERYLETVNTPYLYYCNNETLFRAFLTDRDELALNSTAKDDTIWDMIRATEYITYAQRKKRPPED